MNIICVCQENEKNENENLAFIFRTDINKIIIKFGVCDMILLGFDALRLNRGMKYSCKII